MTITGLFVLVIWILVVVAIVCALLWFLDWIAHPNRMNMPQNLHTILKIIIVAIAVLIVLSWVIGYLPGPPGWHQPTLI